MSAGTFRPRRRGAGWSTLAVLISSVAGGLLVSPAAAQAPVPPSPALEEYGACLAGAGAGDLLLLLDQSQSLKSTDPQDQRVAAARLLLEQLQSSVGSAGISLDVSVAGFDADYEEVTGWRSLDEGSTAGLVQTLETFRSRDDGIDTDYWTALEGARRSLRAKADGRDRCQAVVWLTDGAFDVDPGRGRADERKPYAPDADLTTRQGADAATAAGRAALCEPRGLADQLRASGITVLAVGLQATTAAGDFAFVQGVATGTEPGGQVLCGSPTTEAVGDFRLATDLDDLLFVVQALGNPGSRPIDQRKAVCPVTACVAQAHAFVLDDSISRVTVLAGASAPGIEVSLQPPGAEPPLVLRYDAAALSGSSRAGTATVEHTWVSPTTLSLVLTRDSGASWTGSWSVTFVDPSGTRPDAVSRTSITLDSDVVPVWPGQESAELRAGAVVDGAQFGLASKATGEPIAPQGLLGQGSLTVTLRDLQGQETPLAELPVTRADEPVELDLTGADPGRHTVRLRLSLTTAALPGSGGAPEVPGTELADQVVDLAVLVLPPLEFPRAAERVDFGRVEGTGPSVAQVGVTGPGCVWLKSVNVTAVPNGSGEAVVTSAADGAASCVEVAAGDEASLPVSLTLGAGGNGAVGGVLVLGIAPAGAPERALEQRVPFLGDAEKPVDAALAGGAFAVALVLGLGLPVLFLYGLAWWTSRIPPIGLLAGLIPVTLDGTRLLRGGQPFWTENDDVEPVPVTSKGGREVALPGGVRLRTRLSKVPGEGGYVLLDAPGRISMAGRPPHATKSGTQSRMPLAVHNSWHLVLDPTSGSAEVLVLAVSTADNRVFDELTTQVREDGPGLLARLLASVGTPSPADGGTGQGAQDGWFGAGGPATSSAAQPAWFSPDAPTAAPALSAPTTGRTGAAAPAQPAAAPPVPSADEPGSAGHWFDDGRS